MKYTNPTVHNLPETEFIRRPQSTPAVAELKNFTAIGDGLAGQFAQLHRDPTPPGCEQLFINLQGVARVIMRIRDGLMADRDPANIRH